MSLLTPPPHASKLYTNTVQYSSDVQSIVNIIILNKCVPPESTIISTPNPPVSSRTTDSRSEEPLYTGITLAVHTDR